MNERSKYGEYVETAARIAGEAGELVRELVRQGVGIRYKGAVDLVTEADEKAEALILARLNEAHPDHDILSEEAGILANESRRSSHLWIVDPLDGTTNFVHGFPVYAVSIALEIEGTVVAGAVCDPNAGELFTAGKGLGAKMNGSPISVSNTADLNEALLATGFPYFYRERPDEVLKLFRAFSLRAQGVRRVGAAALDLRWLACGRFDGFWELGLKPWDTAAASLVLTEGGGTISKLDGSAFDIRVQEALATNELLHRAMLDIIESTR